MNRIYFAKSIKSFQNNLLFVITIIQFISNKQLKINGVDKPTNAVSKLFFIQKQVRAFYNNAFVKRLIAFMPNRLYVAPQGILFCSRSITDLENERGPTPVPI